MGIMEALNFMVNNGFLNINTNGSIYVFAQLFSNTAYTFLPILIAYSGAIVFGANPYLGAVIGMIMIPIKNPLATIAGMIGTKISPSVLISLCIGLALDAATFLSSSLLLSDIPAIWINSS